MAVSGPRLLVVLRKEFKKKADPEKAPQMQQYMKSVMPYHGVPSPLLKAICRSTYSNIHFRGPEEWRRCVEYIWKYARFREERYAALNLCSIRAAAEFQSVEMIPLYEKLITSGAWWDYVDDIATHRIADILRLEPTKTKRILRTWSKSENIWKRRTSIICQVNFGEKILDEKLLHDCIAPSLGDKQFFIQKAIGWALRSQAWKQPKNVVKYIEEHREQMSTLARREALKNLVRNNEISEKKYEALMS